MSERFLDNTSNLNTTIHYRLYKEADSSALINLEEEAPQQRFFRTIHREAYDYRCQAFQDNLIIVAEDINPTSSDKRICAAVCAGIKNISFQNEKVRAAIMFDLRVSSKYQRRGIGEMICRKLEEECIKKGVEFIYLSVNGNNERAIFLYKKLGYEIFSHRKYDVIQIPKQNDGPVSLQKKIKIGDQEHDIIFQRLTKNEAQANYEKSYGKMDLAPSSKADWDEVLNQLNYKGTYSVRTSDNKNIVGLSVSKFPYSGFMGIKSVLFPSHYYNGFLFPAICIALIAYGLQGPWESLQNYINSFELVGILTWIISLLCFVVPFTLAASLFLHLRSLFLTFAGFDSRGRYFGPFSEVQNNALMKPMFEFLMSNVIRTTSNDNIDSVLYNRDITDKYFEYIVEKPGNLPEKKFMGKYLKTSKKASLKDYQPSKVMFFDFRDV